jgi:hypothetical protein
LWREFDSQRRALLEGCYQGEARGRSVSGVTGRPVQFPRRRQQGNVSRETRSPEPREQGTGQQYNGPSVRPAMSSRSNYIAFTTNATGIYGEANGAEIADVFVRFLGGE